MYVYVYIYIYIYIYTYITLHPAIDGKELKNGKSVRY